MHARSTWRRRLWYGGSACGTVAGFIVHPLLGAAVGGAAAAVVFGSAIRPSSDFYIRPIRRSDRASRSVALTFDDGPDPTRTPQILEVLAEWRALATFFMIGRRAAAAPDLVRQVLGAGHEVGGHTYSHARTLPFGGTGRQSREIERGRDALMDAGAREVRWFRPPMGIATPALARALERSPLRPVHWSVHSRDLGDPHEERIASRVLSRVRGGDIVLMHDGSDRHGSGPAALPAALCRILAGLRRRGLEPVTLSTLLGAAEAMR